MPDSPLVPPTWAAPTTVPAPGPARSVERDRRAVPDIMYRKRRTATLQRMALFARLVAAVLCLAVLTVLTTDTRKGWALDSYSNYTQLRYSEAVNMIGFMYSVFQFFALAFHLTRKKHLIPRPMGYYFDFTMDQKMCCILLWANNKKVLEEKLKTAGCSNAWEWWVALSSLVGLSPADLPTKILLLLPSVALSSTALLARWLLILLSRFVLCASVLSIDGNLCRLFKGPSSRTE